MIAAGVVVEWANAGVVKSWYQTGLSLSPLATIG